MESLSGLANHLPKSMEIPSLKPMPRPDTRSRVERREDFEKELEALDKMALIELKDTILDMSSSDLYQSKFWDKKEDLENSLVKLIRYMDKFDDLNSEESRKVALKEQELRLEAKHDWAEKFRLFFFRVLATGLFISSLFAIGYIEHNYEWAKLPLSKYVKAVPQVPVK